MDYTYLIDKAEQIDWLQIGGEAFALRAGTFAVLGDWAEWIGENGINYAAPLSAIEAISF